MTDPGRDGRPEAHEAGGPTTSELIDLLRQERADFRNYRRRVTDERAAEEERLRGLALEPILPLLDDLGRAVAEIPPDLEEHPWARGIAMLRSRLESTLAGLGLVAVGTVGEPFDPSRHEAISLEPDPAATGEDVAQVIRPGYRLGGRLLRPAEVVVRGPAGAGAGGPESETTRPSADARRAGPVGIGRP